MFTSPSQILCTVFGVNIYYYGLIMAIAIACGTLVSDWLGCKYLKLKNETIIDLAPYLIIFGLIGARLYYCIMDYGFYMRFPTEIFAIRHGGISIHGAIIGGFAGLLIFAKKHKLSSKLLCDISSVGLALGQAIGRRDASADQASDEIRSPEPLDKAHPFGLEAMRRDRPPGQETGFVCSCCLGSMGRVQL